MHYRSLLDGMSMDWWDGHQVIRIGVGIRIWLRLLVLCPTKYAQELSRCIQVSKQ